MGKREKVTPCAQEIMVELSCVDASTNQDVDQHLRCFQ